MIRRSICLSLAAVAALGTAPSLADTGATATTDSDLYARMQRVNTNLTSFQADVTVAISTHGPPFISPTLQGKMYYKRPDKNAVVFDTVPFIAQQAKHVVAQIEPPAEWPQVYTVTPTGDDGTTSTFRLVRKKNGRIDHVDVQVDDATATVSAMTYYYNDNGGTIAFHQSYDKVGDDYVLKEQTGKVDIPHYNADVTSTFSNYRLNVSVPDTVFEQ
jgi:outer membrane lipoprotein-sorting protein